MSLGRIDFVCITEWRSAQSKHVVHLIIGPTNNIHDLWSYANIKHGVDCYLCSVCVMSISIVCYYVLFGSHIALYHIPLCVVAVGVCISGGDC